MKPDGPSGASSLELKVGLRVNVLLVEDFDVVRPEMEALLAGLPAVDRIVSAAGVAEAEEAIAEAAFDAWVLDYDLGDGTAADLIESLAGETAGDRPAVFVVTNHASPALCRRCLAAGADGFYDKATDLDEMLTALEEEKEEDPCRST